jgi:hypothetical protein
MKTLTTIPTELVQSLRTKIYDSLIANPDYGLGEINPCKEEADSIVNEWLDENNLVEIENEPILTND